MKNQQLIKQIENKINEIQTTIQTWEQELTNYRTTLTKLIQQLNQIKQPTK